MIKDFPQAVLISKSALCHILIMATTLIITVKTQTKSKKKVLAWEDCSSSLHLARHTIFQLSYSLSKTDCRQHTLFHSGAFSKTLRYVDRNT